MHRGLGFPLTALLAFACLACPRFDASEPPELDPGEHMLLTPRGDPEALLGRTVEQDASGGYVISDERPPGCQVQVRRVPERWHRRYQQDVGRVAHFGTGDTPIGELTAEFGKSLRVEAEVENIEVLHADLRGCTGTVVSSVRVGTGRREIHARKESKIQGRAKVKGVAAGGGAGQWRDVARSHGWEVPQAWSFGVTEAAGEDLRVEIVLMPANVQDGDTFSIRILAARQVYLVCGYEREDGGAGLILPNEHHPLPVIAAGGNVELTMRAVLPSPEAPSHTKFFLYAFAHQGDYEAFRPPQGVLDDKRVSQYFAALPDRLAEIPSRRWVTKDAFLRIDPRPTASETF